MDGGHPLEQVLGHVADRVELGVAGLAAGFEVGELRDRPGAEHADAQGSIMVGVVCHGSPEEGDSRSESTGGSPPVSRNDGSVSHTSIVS